MTSAIRGVGCTAASSTSWDGIVVGGQWAAGTSLPNEDELAAELGVSRTVVREAIKVLQAKGLVEVRPKTGTRVRPRRAWHLLDADVVSWQFADIGARRRPARAARGTGDDRGDRGPARCRPADRGTAGGDRGERTSRRSGWAEPIARRAADLDFHGAVVDAAQNSFLSHVNALVRIALEAADCPTSRRRRRTRHGWQRRCAPMWRGRSAPVMLRRAEAAMRSLVALDRANMREER